MKLVQPGRIFSFVLHFFMWKFRRSTEWEEKGSGQLRGHVGRGHCSVQHKQLNKIGLNCLFVSVFCLTWLNNFGILYVTKWLQWLIIYWLSNAFNSKHEPHFTWICVLLAWHQHTGISIIVDRIENLPISSILAHLDTYDTIVKRICQIGLVFIDNLKKRIICEANL